MNLIRTYASLCALALLCFQSSTFGDLLVNDKSIIDEEWAELTDWAVQTPPGATAPSVKAGVLSVSMVGSSTGYYGPSGVRNGAKVPLEYIVTTRVKVSEFPDIISFDTRDSNTQGVQLVDIRGEDILTVAVTPTGLFINDQVSPGGHNWTKINLKTDADTFYTWQFQVSELAGNANEGGTVEIYRRLLDTDPFILVGSSEIRGTDGADAVYAGRIWYNEEGKSTQGVLVSEYFQLGQAVP